MDWDVILIGAGLILTGIIIASPIAYHLGRRTERQCFVYEEIPETTDDILRAEIIL